MKIAVVGCGAVGGFYGSKLAAKSKAEVHFLLRSDYKAVTTRGMIIKSPDGGFTVYPKCARRPEDIGVSELVIVGLKTTANFEFRSLLTPLVGSSTLVLTLQNGLGNEEELSRLFTPEQILGGLCFVCLNRVDPGVIHHIAHGQIIMGEFVGKPTARTHAICSLFVDSGIQCSVTENLARAHWEKLVWNIPFNGLGVAGAAGWDAVQRGIMDSNTRLGPCLSTSDLLGDARWTGLVRELMLEVILAARGLGYDVAEDLADEQLARTRSMGPYKASTLLDFENGHPLELDSLFREPLRRAASVGVPTPRLAALCSVLDQLQRQSCRTQA